MHIALKVDVDTYRGTLEGVPALLRLFDEYQVRATFLFSLGPDHTGRALRRVFRPGFLGKVRRTSVASNYGLKTLLYGTLRPGPHIGRKAGDAMRAVARAGHEVGIHCYDHVRWQDNVAHRDAGWTRRELERAMTAFDEVFGQPARVHGAAGWQLNPHLLALEQELGFRYASDVRGRFPFYPQLHNIVSRCPQIPTTLPTLGEMLAQGDVTPANVHEYLYAESRRVLPHGHVYSVDAADEGIEHLEILEKLLVMWKGQEGSLRTLGDIRAELDLERLPVHQVGWTQVPGCQEHVAAQSLPVEV